jgi:hypothetical protein
LVRLLVIYFSALLSVALAPAKIGAQTFYNLSRAIHLHIDPASPATAVEQDFISSKKPALIVRAFASLNDGVGRPPSHRPSLPRAERALIDYSASVRSDAHADFGFGFQLSGPVELKQGLALTDRNRIEIYREARGRLLELGEVDIQKGHYRIRVADLEGRICGKLTGLKGEISGQGCFSLERVALKRQSEVSGPLLTLEKNSDLLASLSIPKGVEATTLKMSESFDSQRTSPAQPLRQKISRREAKNRIISFYDYDNPEAKPLPAAIDTTTSGREDESSTTIMSLAAPHHPPVRIVANAYTPSRGAVIPPKKTLAALEGLAQEMGTAWSGQKTAGRFGGTIWGRTLDEGRSVAGRQVEIEGRPDLKATYLNEFYIPDSNQKFTASHGIYAFVGVPEGEYSIRALNQEQFAGFQNVSVREEALALGDINSTERWRSARLTVFDLINKTSQGAVATLQNFDEDVVIEAGQADVQVRDSDDTAFAVVNPLDRRYLTAQYILNPGEDLYNFPLIPSDWVEQVLSQAKLEKPLKSKLVFGMGSQKPFRVQAIGSKEAQVIYVDSEGQVTNGNFGSAGGGFFVVDPEDQVIEYAIEQVGEKSVRVVYAPTSANVVSVIQLD